MRNLIALTIVAFVAVAPASANTVKLKAPANCNDIAVAGWIPFPGGTELATIVATWTKTSRAIIGVVVCESSTSDDILTFGAVTGATGGGWVIQAGTAGKVCIVGVCSASGKTTVQVNLITGQVDPTFAKAIGSGSAQTRGRLVKLNEVPPIIKVRIKELAAFNKN